MASISFDKENIRKYAIVIAFVLMIVLGGLTAFIGIQLDRGGFFTAGGGGGDVCSCTLGDRYGNPTCGGSCPFNRRLMFRCVPTVDSDGDGKCDYVPDGCEDQNCPPVAPACASDECPDPNENYECGTGVNAGKRRICGQLECAPGTVDANGDGFYNVITYVDDPTCPTGGGNQCPANTCNPSTFAESCGTGGNAGKKQKCVQTSCPAGTTDPDGDGLYYTPQYVTDASCDTGGGPTTPPSSPSSPTSSSSSSGGGGSCSGQDRPNGCNCNNDGQCSSGFCGGDNVCRRPPECRDATGRPSGCQCSTNSQCATGNCQNGQCRPTSGCDAQNNRPNGCFCGQDSRCASGKCDVNTNTCVGGGGPGGNLPGTGLFDEDGRPMLIGLLLLLAGLGLYWINRPKYNLQTQPAQAPNDGYVDPDIARLIEAGTQKVRKDK